MQEEPPWSRTGWGQFGAGVLGLPAGRHILPLPLEIFLQILCSLKENNSLQGWTQEEEIEETGGAWDAPSPFPLTGILHSYSAILHSESPRTAHNNKESHTHS